uniref:Vesicle transport protein n=1 Tax=Chenopodium quinoa TaxID=63459 RepID=A0A803L2M3_CHEQI
MWKSILGGDDDEERNERFFDDQTTDDDDLCALSYTQSMIVFVKAIKFALLFTFGNVMAVGSTAFLIGPAEQLRKMFDPVRLYATAVYLGCVVLALICAILIHSKILTMFAMICEICALIWYSLSYIPFARRVVSDVMIRLFDTEIEF